MKTKNQTHTPGPWTYGPKNDDGHRFIFGPDETPDHNESGEPIIAELWDASDSVSEADARLIAAAPDLLAGAKWALSALEAKNGMCHEDGPTECEACALRAAIARAEGGQ